VILKNLVVGLYITNAYIFGSSETKDVVVIDPGSEPQKIIKSIEELNAKPIAVLITHGHGDHTGGVDVIASYFDIPVMLHKRARRNYVGITRELSEGDIIEIGEYSLHVLETPGHAPDSLCFYSKDVKEYNGQQIDGIIFTGDLIFRRSIGRSDFGGGNSRLLFSSIQNKIMYNPEITNNFLIFSGHSYQGFLTSVGEERKSNMFRANFLKKEDL
jgi:glyoxylase-like metal-dependent hydrolase (beta-lactamase superfamily II)